MTATTAVSGRTAARTASGDTTPSGAGATRSTANPSAASASIARMTAGCSKAVTTRWRPRAARAAPRMPIASASVPPLVKTTSSGSASSARATSARAASRARDAAAPAAWAAAGLPKSSRAASDMAARTSAAGRVEAALSR